jgi:Arc/MetJ-type ribon-helix-helix transcriptional regulator
MTVTVDPKLVEWLDKMIRLKTFASRSHGVEYCLTETKKKMGT